MFKTLYASIIREVIAAESALKGQSGEVKKAYVTDKLVAMIDIPMIPNIIEEPIKRWLFGYLIDLACEKLNWLLDWAFGDVMLEPEQVEKIAESLEAPISVMSKAAEKPAATLDERINNLYQAYNIEPITPIPVPVSDKILDTTEAKTEDKTSDKEDSTWTKSLAFTVNVEGGKNYTGEANGKYTLKNPADKGGPTNRGITKDTLLAAYAQGIVKNDNLDILTADEAATIYKANYWDRYCWGEIPWPVCLALFDITVNHGGGGMAKIVQRTANALGWKLEVDGKFGPKTFEAIVKISGAQPESFTQELLVYRKCYYDDIIVRDSTQEKNRNGWYNRLKALAATAGVKSPV
jgi:lysozyme family protein